MTPAPHVLTVIGGHAFDHDAFRTMLDSLTVDCTLVEQPSAQVHFASDQADRWDAYLMYDMPGYEFQADHTAPHLFGPPAEYRNNFLELVDRGHGFVFLHHALASWPTWSEYSAIMGGRFRFVRKNGRPDSGYRHDVDQKIAIVAHGHPVLEGLSDGFLIRDELYLAEIDDGVEPLLVTDAELTDRTVWSTWNAVVGDRDSNKGWTHPAAPGAAVAWIRPHPKSRIVYIQFGDGPSAFGNASFRRLLNNALTWVGNR